MDRYGIYMSTHPNRFILWMDEMHFAPPKKPWNDDSPVNTNKRYGFNHSFLGGCDMDFATIHRFTGESPSNLHLLGFASAPLQPPGAKTQLRPSAFSLPQELRTLGDPQKHNLDGPGTWHETRLNQFHPPCQKIAKNTWEQPRLKRKNKNMVEQNPKRITHTHTPRKQAMS